MAERLTFVDNSIPYASMLVSEHLSRYLLVRETCKNRRVLDIACGEGYGSALLRAWGASEVVGFDVAPEAVENARTLFGKTPGLSFVQGDATQCGDQLGVLGQFDLIVCFETMEHVENVEGLLQGFSKLRKPGGAIVISCPNDPAVIPGQANEFHLKTYSFDDFKKAVTPILGPADAWLLGTSLIGFGALPADSTLLSAPSKGLIGLMDLAEAQDAQFIPSQVGHEVDAENAAYYIAAWGCTLSTSSAFAPISFFAYESPWNNWVATKKELESAGKDNAVLRIQLDHAAKRMDDVRQDFETALAQRDLTITNLRKLNDEISEQLRIARSGLSGALSRGLRSIKKRTKSRSA